MGSLYLYLFFVGRECVCVCVCVRSVRVHLQHLRRDRDRAVVTVIALYKPMHKQLTNIYITNQSVIDATVAFFLFFTTIFEDDKRKRTPGYGPDEAICRLWYTKVRARLLTENTYNNNNNNNTVFI